MSEFSQKEDMSEWSRKVRTIMDEMGKRTFCDYRSNSQWHPNVNLYECADAFYLCVELAGVIAGTLAVECVGEREVCVAGQRPRPGPGEPDEVLSIELMEIDEGGFERRIELSAAVEQGSLQIRHQEGYAWIKLRKSTKR